MAEMEIGMSHNKVLSILERKPDFTLRRNIDGKIFLYKRIISNIDFKSNYELDSYYFRNDTLVYWGTIDDFLVHSKERIRKAGEIAADFWKKKL